MPCNKYLKHLPWRKRRLEDVEVAESIGLQIDENGQNLTSNINTNEDVKKYTCKSTEEDVNSSLQYFSWFRKTPLRYDQDCINLIKYIFQGNHLGLSAVLKNQKPDELNKLRIEGQSLLHILCFKKDIGALKILLEYGLNPERTNDDGVSPLHLAVKKMWTEGVSEFLFHGASSNILPDAKRSSSWKYQEIPILTAARNGDYATAILLLEQGPNLRLTDSDRNNILHLACSSNCFELVKRLVSEEIILAELSATNNEGNSALHCLMIDNASYDEQDVILDCVELLLRKGIDINCKNIAEETPLYLAARKNLARIVKFLLQSSADPTIKRRDGKTVLHAACEGTSPQSLESLLEGGTTQDLILIEDKSGSSPFHLAVDKCSTQCCEILLGNGDHLTRIDSQGRRRSSLIVKNMPSAAACRVLQSVFDKNIEVSQHDVVDPNFYIKMDFSVILSKSNEDVEASLITDFNSSDLDSLLKHPLIESFLYVKWHKMKLFFYSYVLLYFLFLVVHTFYIIKTYNMKIDWDLEPQMLKIIHGIHIFMVLALMIPSSVMIFANIRKYFKQWETYFKVIALSTAAFIVFCRDSPLTSDPEYDEITKRNVAAVSIFFTWVELMMLLGRFPSLGIYILMFTRVAKSIVKFVLAFSSLLIAFTLAFSLLLEGVPIFTNFPVAFVKSLMMMIGEIDFENIYEQKMNKTDFATKIMILIFLVVFLFLIPVLMANLLIGLAVNDLPNLQYQGKIRRLLKEASYLESYEKILLLFKEWTYFPHSIIDFFARVSIKREITIYPNKIGKYGRRSQIVPADAVEASIKLGSKSWAEKDVEDFRQSFKMFYSDYKTNQIQLETALQIIFDSINKQESRNDHNKLKLKESVSKAMLRSYWR